MFHSSLAPWKVTKERPRFRFFLEKIIFIAAYSVCIISAKEGDISPNCYDVPGWVDSIGDGCESYGYAILDDYYRTDENVDWCVLVGASYENDGDTAQSDCCICGGGIRIESDVPTSFPSVSTEPSYTARPTACYDIPGWVDPHEDGCKWYSEGKEGVRCQTAGTVLKMDGLTASDACCVCGGGTESADAPTPSPTVNNDPCFDDHTWTDALGFGCDWYKNMQAKAVAKGGGKCVDKIGRASGNEACCACGGGYSSILEVPLNQSSMPSDGVLNSNYDANYYENCKDIEMWTDPFTAYGCPFYAQASLPPSPEDPSYFSDKGLSEPTNLCVDFEAKSFYSGYSVKSACCACGGGLNTERVLVEEKKNSPNRKMYPNAPCLDVNETLWKVTMDDGFEFTCSDMELQYKDPDGFTCRKYGNVIGHGRLIDGRLSAEEACCTCGGGYSGPLLGKQFRMAFTGDDDAYYTLFTEEESGIRNGSTPVFMEEVARYYGFGLYVQNISQESLDATAGSLFSGCLRDIEYGFVDLCIGPFWNTSTFGFRSKSWSIDEFFLLVPVEVPDKWIGFVTPFAPFDVTAWLTILICVLYMAAVLNIIHSDKVFSKSPFSRLGQLVYDGLRSFTAGDVVHATEEPTSAEKTIIAGFAIFSLLILTAYTATSAAALLTNSSLKFESLDDIIEFSGSKLCIWDRVSDDFLQVHPNAAQVLDKLPLPGNPTLELLEFVKNSSARCDAAVVHFDAYNWIVNDPQYERFCGAVDILKDDVLMTFENVLVINSNLGEWGIELNRQVNNLIDLGMYTEIHENFRQYLFNGEHSCEEGSEEPIGDSFQLNFYALCFPVFVSTLFTSFGLWLHCTKRSNRLKVRKSMGQVLTEAEQDIILRGKLESTSPSNLYRQGILLHIDEEILANAVNDLPNRKVLEDLIFDKKASKYRRDMIILSELSAMDLYQILVSCSKVKSSQKSADQCIDDSDDPKHSLIEEIMKCPACLDTAISKAYENNDVDDIISEEQSLMMYNQSGNKARQSIAEHGLEYYDGAWVSNGRRQSRRGTDLRNSLSLPA